MFYMNILMSFLSFQSISFLLIWVKKIANSNISIYLLLTYMTKNT